MALLYLKSKWKDFVFNLSVSDNPLYRFYCKRLYKPKPNTLVSLIDQFSKTKEIVTFLQVGANDGFFHDPLHKFIKKYRWRGVMLEPQKDVYEKYLSKLYQKTEGVIPVNAALDHQDGFKPIYRIAFSKSRWATGLTSFNKSVLVESINSGHVARCAKRYHEPLPENKDQYIADEKIECISPATLLQKYNLTTLDWLQIDAEGYDFEIIKMLKIEKSSPTVIVFEHSHLSKEDYTTCTKHLHANNYAVTRINENTVAMKKPLLHFEPFFQQHK